MGKLVGLQRRGNIWRYRRWVPLNLRDRIGKSELIKSLGTSDYQTAIRRYRTVSRDIEQIITNAHGNVFMDDFDGSRLIQGSDTVELQFKAPPHFDDDSLRTLIKTVVEEVISVSALKKPFPWGLYLAHAWLKVVITAKIDVLRFHDLRHVSLLFKKD